MSKIEMVKSYKSIKRDTYVEIYMVGIYAERILKHD